jgi:hypothetical protein
MRLPRLVHLVAIVALMSCDRVTPPPRQPAPAKAQHRAAPEDLRRRLIVGRWVRDLSDRDGQNLYVYTFAPDGAYSNQLITDYQPAPVTGRWELKRDDSGKDHLLLHGHDGARDYDWLGHDSIVRFDDTAGDLLVSGPKYDGEQRLRHQP